MVPSVVLILREGHLFILTQAPGYHEWTDYILPLGWAQAPQPAYGWGGTADAGMLDL